ncbi:uncharacterized protein LOC133868855 [Alnus glutinosa]|uniref:uncharacterized protein LOC133868855 n=1 Tax=Alnus glutinosa TaxID=3517 RepID=UPI002D798CF4|nr:uncharacterized protein LOC133868855 [Alnus glutinosa]
MCGWGFGGDALRHFCYSSQENVEHLFFQYSFSYRVWRAAMEGCMTRPEIEWEKVKDWYEAKFIGRSLMANLCRLFLVASIYHLWKLRNDLCHGNTPRTEEVVVKNIRWEVRTRVMAKGRFKRSTQNERLAKLWNLSTLV